MTQLYMPDSFMIDAIDLTVAGAEEIEQSFDFVSFLTADDTSGTPISDALVYLSIGGKQHQRIPLRPGSKFEIGQSVPTAKLHWDAQSSVGAVALYFSNDGSRPSAEPPVNIPSVSVDSPTGLSASADVTATANTSTTVLAANTSRVEAWITNLAAGAETLRVGDAVSATKGTPVAPGQTIVLNTTAAIKVFNPSATVDQDVALLEVTS